MDWALLGGALAGGAFLTIQAGINSQLRHQLGQPVVAALVSFIVGTAALMLYLLALRVDWPVADRWGSVPWWVWTGGLIGAAYVTATVILAPRLGAGLFTTVVVTGQLLTALLLDHYGWLGFAEQPLTLGRWIGAALLIAGVVLIRGS